MTPKKRFTLALLEAKQRFPDVISLQFDPVTHEVVDYEFHNAGYAQHEQFLTRPSSTWRRQSNHWPSRCCTETRLTVKLLRVDARCGTKVPKVFSFDTDESGNPTEFRVKYDTQERTVHDH